eukprot:3430336-Heterocapsa_arctica.AAC.1
MAGLTSLWWPHAVREFCFSQNIALTNKNCAYRTSDWRNRWEEMCLSAGKSRRQGTRQKTMTGSVQRSG